MSLVTRPLPAQDGTDTEGTQISLPRMGYEPTYLLFEKERETIHTLDRAVTVIGYRTKPRGLSPRANYADRATAACRLSYCQILRIEGATWSTRRIPYCRNIGFLDRSRYFFYQVAPQLYNWVDPVPDPLLPKKPNSSANRTRTFGYAARNSGH
jgi:hypothetical protein